MTTATIEMSDLAGKYLTFGLDEEIYGLTILKVQEIIGLMTITRVPRTPSYVRGIINLRGRVIPVVDLRLKFGLESAIDTERTCIVVVQVGAASDQSITMGLLVDHVSEVADIAAGSIESAPKFGGAVGTDFVLGIGKTPAGVTMLLDIDRILSVAEILQVEDEVVGKVQS